MFFSNISLSKTRSEFNLPSENLRKDSLKALNYEALEKSYYNNGNNYNVAKNYANSYLERAKKESNYEEMAKAFIFLSEVSNEKKALNYGDSIIYYGELAKNNELLIKGNIQKGIQYYHLAEYNKSLEKLLDAQEIAKEENNEFQQIVIKHHIGNLKNITKQREEALEIFRSNIKYFNKNGKKDVYEKRQYLKSLFRLANVYNVLKKLDSAAIINKIGIKESLKSENRYMYPIFLACYGSTLQLSGRTDKALDSLKKSARLTNYRKARLASIYLIIGKIEKKKKNHKEYENYLLKIDSLYSIHPETIKETKIAYKALINFYKGNGDDKNQIAFMDKLIEVDNLLDAKFKNVNKNIARNYENKSLLNEKENIIKKLDDKRKKYLYLTTGLIAFLICLAFLVFRFYRKKKVYQVRFNEIIKEKPKVSTKPIKHINIPEDIAKNINEGLKSFEDQNAFTQKNVSLKSLATDIGTNTSYLSFYINSNHEKNFSKYLSDLRIQYTIEKIKNDKKFRSYTIKAIANEVGFKSQEAFSKSFFKKTGLYPSFFINNLQKQKKQ